MVDPVSWFFVGFCNTTGLEKYFSEARRVLQKIFFRWWWVVVYAFSFPVQVGSLKSFKRDLFFFKIRALRPKA